MPSRMYGEKGKRGTSDVNHSAIARGRCSGQRSTTSRAPFFLCVRRGRRRNGVNTHFNKSQIGRPAAGPTVSKIKPVRIYKREGGRGGVKEKKKTSRRKRRKQEPVNEPKSRASCCGFIDVRPHTLDGKTRFSFSVLCCSVEPKPILPSPYRAFFFLSLFKAKQRTHQNNSRDGAVDQMERKNYDLTHPMPVESSSLFFSFPVRLFSFVDAAFCYFFSSCFCCFNLQPPFNKKIFNAKQQKLNKRGKLEKWKKNPRGQRRDEHQGLCACLAM